jgi:alkyl hydroperoxide reductase subunit F
VYASRKRLKTVFITNDFLGQSSVSGGIENWIGTVKISGTELSENLEKHLRAYAEGVVDIRTGELCEEVSKIPEGFLIKTNTAQYKAKTVLTTAGSYRRRLEAKGADQFEHKGLTYCATCDGPIFSGQDVAVIGGGNAAFESSAQLLAYCKSVSLINRGDSFRADPVTVEKLLKNLNFKIIKNAVVTEVSGEKFVSGLTYRDPSGDQKISVTGIFVEIGLLPNTTFMKDVVKLNAYNQIVVDPRTQRASTAGVWAAGDCTDGLYHQNNIASGDAVKALEDIYSYLHAK